LRCYFHLLVFPQIFLSGTNLTLCPPVQHALPFGGPRPDQSWFSRPAQRYPRVVSRDLSASASPPLCAAHPRHITYFFLRISSFPRLKPSCLLLSVRMPVIVLILIRPLLLRPSSFMPFFPNSVPPDTSFLTCFL